MEFSRDGSVLAVAGYGALRGATDDVLGLWSVADGRHIRTFRGKDADESFALSPDGKVIAIPNERAGIVVLWDVPGAKELRRLKHPSVSALCYSPTGKALASYDFRGGPDREGDELRVWDIATGSQLFATPSPPGIYTAFAADGRLLFSGSDRRLRCWDPATRKERAPAVLPPDTDTFLTLSPSGNEVSVRHLKGDRIRLHDTATGKLLRTLGDAKDSLDGGSFSRDGRRVAFVKHGGRIEVWETATGVRRSSFTRRNPVSTFVPEVDIVPDGKHLMVRQAHFGSTARIGFTNTEFYTLDGRLVRRAPEAFNVVFDSSGRSVAVWHPDGADRTGVITIHDTATWLAGGAKKE